MRRRFWILSIWTNRQVVDFHFLSGKTKEVSRYDRSIGQDELKQGIFQFFGVLGEVLASMDGQVASWLSAFDSIALQAFLLLQVTHRQTSQY